MPANLFHPTALVETSHIGTGTRVWAYAHILPGATIGENCNICDHSYVEAGAVTGNNVTIKNHVCVWDGITLHDDVFVGPFVAFTNDLYPRSPRMRHVRERYERRENWLVETVVEEGATIGANATIIGGIRIGSYSFIAAGATVTTDVEPFALMIGCPAKRVAFVCRCGHKLDANPPSTACSHCGTLPDFFVEHLAQVNCTP